MSPTALWSDGLPANNAVRLLTTPSASGRADLPYHRLLPRLARAAASWRSARAGRLSGRLPGPAARDTWPARCLGDSLGRSAVVGGPIMDVPWRGRAPIIGPWQRRPPPCGTGRCSGCGSGRRGWNCACPRWPTWTNWPAWPPRGCMTRRSAVRRAVDRRPAGPAGARRAAVSTWANSGAWSPQDWTLNLVVDLGGAIAGTQGISGRDFAVLREVRTGSWLGQRYQRQGIGTEMRAAVLHLAFTGLGAEYATSERVHRQRRVAGCVAQARLCPRRHRSPGHPGQARARSTGCAWTGRPGRRTAPPRWRSPAWPNACPTSASPANPLPGGSAGHELRSRPGRPGRYRQSH